MKTPPLLLGLALLFWGWQTGLLFLAVPLAVILEGARVTTRRFDFTTKDFNRISDFCAIFFCILAVYSYASQSRPMAKWVPVALWPLLTAQVWSTVQGVDSGAIFWTARQKLKKLGLTQGRQLDLTYPYFIVVMISASAANVRDIWFYTAILILGGYALWPQRSRRHSPVLWVALLLAVGGLGFVGQTGLHALHEKVDRSFEEWLLEWMTPDHDPFQNVTALGDIGELKLSGKIIFRVSQNDDASMVRLLREAAYISYHNAHWFVSGRSWQGLAPEPEGDNWKLGPHQSPVGSMIIHDYLTDGQGLLKLPLGAFLVENLPVAKVAVNEFGTVRVEQGPGLASYRVSYGPDSPRDPPPQDQDLVAPLEELPALDQVFQELNLAVLPPKEQAQKVKDYLQGQFHYSLKLQPPASEYTALADFLLRTRTGHCEYFATAAVLLLRTCGVPARYATGYMVDEYSRLEGRYIVRARHAHAWALAWIDGRWVALDATPPDWLALETESSPIWQPLQDAWLWLRFKISQWRWSETRDNRARYLPWFLIPLALYLLWRIRGRQTALQSADPDGQSASGPRKPGADSPFYQVENRLTMAGYSRPPHQPLSLWLDTLDQLRPPSMDLDELRAMLALHQQLRFNPKTDGPAVRNELESKVKSWLANHPPEH